VAWYDAINTEVNNRHLIGEIYQPENYNSPKCQSQILTDFHETDLPRFAQINKEKCGCGYSEDIRNMTIYKGFQGHLNAAQA